MIKETPEGIVFQVKVIPKSNKSAIVGWENDELKIRIAAIPEKGDANAELICFFSKLFKISKQSVKLLSGETSRHKRVLIKGVDPQRFNSFC